jgi:hypothetical protein
VPTTTTERGSGLAMTPCRVSASTSCDMAEPTSGSCPTYLWVR